MILLTLVVPSYNVETFLRRCVERMVPAGPEVDILIVDETLSVGDFLFQRKCEQRIQELVDSNNVTVLLVSHSIELVERICQRVCWIEKGQQRMIGPVDKVCAAYKSLSE